VFVLCLQRSEMTSQCAAANKPKPVGMRLLYKLTVHIFKNISTFNFIFYQQ